MHHGLSIRSSLISTTLTMSLTMRFRKCMFMYQVWPIHPRKIINIVCVCVCVSGMLTRVELPMMSMNLLGPLNLPPVSVKRLRILTIR
jgi:hypothetical protein